MSYDHDVLSLDAGALRMGWAVLDAHPSGKPTYVASALEKFPRSEGDTYQGYRLLLEQHWVDYTHFLLDLYNPRRVVSEILPPQGFNNAIQAYLVNVAITTVHAIAWDRGHTVSQIAANTVKKSIGIKNRNGKVGKAGVRDGVVRLLPQLKERVPEWVKVFDEPDAIGVGLAYLGYSVIQ